MEQKLQNNYSNLFSFEIFPPKDSDKFSHLVADLTRLTAFPHNFITCTYGAAGGTRNLTKEISSYVINGLNADCFSHLTCVGHSIDELIKIVNDLISEGINKIVAVRGDPRLDIDISNQAFDNSLDFVDFLKGRFNLFIAISGYPEPHKDFINKDREIEYIKRKIDAGANIMITQLFFNNEHFFDYVEMLRANSINIPVIPGIMPPGSVERLQKINQLCGATIPKNLMSTISSLAIEDQKNFSVEYCAEQCQELVNNGVKNIHLYTMNDIDKTLSIVSNF